MPQDSYWDQACDRIDREFAILSPEARATLKAILEGGMRDAHERGQGVASAQPQPEPEPGEDRVGGTLLLLEEAISMCRKERVAGQHIGAMCSARDDLRELSRLALEAGIRLGH